MVNGTPAQIRLDAGVQAGRRPTRLQPCVQLNDTAPAAFRRCCTNAGSPSSKRRP